MPPVGFEPAVPASERPMGSTTIVTPYTHLFVYYIDRVIPIAMLFL